MLPERPFKNPVARAVLDIRKRLSVAPEDHGQAASDLSALGDAPAAFDNNSGVFLALTSTAALLEKSGEPADVAEAQSRLWSLALQLEDDAVSRTAQAVQAARQALDQSVQKGDKTDMDRKAEALRREIQKHLEALADKARKDGTLMPFDPSQRTLNQQDFNKLTQEMKDAAKAGRMEEAQQKLEQLEKMLDQLKQAEANPSQDRQQARQQRQRGQQQMGAAEDMVQREGTMKGRATGRDTADDKPGRETDGKQQRALRRALGQMMQNFGDLAGKVPDALSQADIAMDQAGQALGKGDDKEAAAAQQRAIDALQKGEQQMSQQMASSLGVSVMPGEGEGQGNGPGDQMAGDDGQGDDPGDDRGQGGRGDRDADAGGKRPGRRPGPRRPPRSTRPPHPGRHQRPRRWRRRARARPDGAGPHAGNPVRTTPPRGRADPPGRGAGLHRPIAQGVLGRAGRLSAWKPCANVMPGLDPGIHAVGSARPPATHCARVGGQYARRGPANVVDSRLRAWHDGSVVGRISRLAPSDITISSHRMLDVMTACPPASVPPRGTSARRWPPASAVRGAPPAPRRPGRGSCGANGQVRGRRRSAARRRGPAPGAS